MDSMSLNEADEEGEEVRFVLPSVHLRRETVVIVAVAVAVGADADAAAAGIAAAAAGDIVVVLVLSICGCHFCCHFVGCDQG